MNTGKILYVINCGNQKTPWYDITDLMNQTLIKVFNRNTQQYDFTPSFTETETKIGLFKKRKSGYVLTRGLNNSLSLEHTFAKEIVPPIEFNLYNLFSKIDSITDSPDEVLTRVPFPFLYKTLLFGSPMYNSEMTQQDIVLGSTFFTRKIDGSLLDIEKNVVIGNDSGILPWFFCFRLYDSPLYFMVVNIDLIDVPDNISSEENRFEPNHTTIHVLNNNDGADFISRVFTVEINNTTENNFGKIIDNQILIQGDNLSLSLFTGGDVHSEFFVNADIRCESNFEYERHGNMFNFKLTDNIGYIQFDWNYNSPISKIFEISGNKFSKKFIVHKIT